MAQTILKASDYLLVECGHRLAPLMRAFGELEADLLAPRLESVRIEAPVFVTGLARAGTTMVLTLLSRADGVATHRYRDFPFLFTPIAWNWFQDRMGAGPGPAVERPHRDRIRITKESAEAFEEPLWQAFFPHTHDPSRCHLLGAQTRNEKFEACFATHLRKILWLRRGTRYLSKGNYNVARIEYLARLFPDARFVVPVREPVSHVRSLVEQHALFCGYAVADARVPRYLAAAGHYEFGPQRRPINLDPGRIGEIAAAWHAGDDWRGYARQWREVYAQVRALKASALLGERIFVLRYEDACARPHALAEELLHFCGYTDAAGRVASAAGDFAAAKVPRDDTSRARTVWDEVGDVASAFGYAPALQLRRSDHGRAQTISSQRVMEEHERTLTTVGRAWITS